MMENPPENNSGQGNNPAAKKSSSTGSMLREARENLGLTVADVAGQIKFAPRQIEALEADDFKSLPEAAFLRGFVRSYAKILKLDPETLLANMPSAKAAAVELVPASVDVPFPSEQPNRQQNMIWLGAASLLAVLVAGFALWHYKTPLKETKQLVKEQTNATPVATPVETPVALPADAKIVSEPLVLKSSTIEPTVHPVPKPRSSAATSSVHEAKTLASARAAKTAAPKPASKAASQVPATLTAADAGAGLKTEELRLVFGEESWTEIKDKDGKIISSQVNPAGSELHVQGNPPFSMLIGHAASASLFYRGKQVDLKPHINRYSEVAHLTLK